MRFTLAAIIFNLTLLEATPVPLQVPRPDGQPGDPKKPVKVYILAGQSNMVGMEDITGASPPYPSVVLSADPAVIPCELSVGTSRTKSACKWIWRGIPALRAHGVYQSADAAAQVGAKVAIHKGAYDPKADYSKQTPSKTATVPLGTAAATIPTIDGPCTPVATAFLDIPATGNYLVHVGFGESSHALATLGGKEVYRKDSGGKPVLTKACMRLSRTSTRWCPVTKDRDMRSRASAGFKGTRTADRPRRLMKNA